VRLFKEKLAKKQSHFYTEPRQSYAKEWEAMESQYGREHFDQFLGHVRSIILKS